MGSKISNVNTKGLPSDPAPGKRGAIYRGHRSVHIERLSIGDTFDDKTGEGF